MVRRNGDMARVEQGWGRQGQDDISAESLFKLLRLVVLIRQMSYQQSLPLLFDLSVSVSVGLLSCTYNCNTIHKSS